MATIPTNNPRVTHSFTPQELQALVNCAASQAMVDFTEHKLGASQFAITLVDLRDFEKPVRASYRGDVQIYPASVIKAFYMAAAHRWMEDGKIEDTPELRRAMHDMIVHSFNEPTGYVIDLLTGTTSGPELPPAEMEQWHDQRNAVNRYFASLGYANINANKKPWCEGPYGREQLAVKTFTPSRNWLTADATARLFTEIATGKMVSPARCEQMKELLHREFARPGNEDNQAINYIGKYLPRKARLWSKAGWMSTARHDAAYVELPNGARFVLVIFTENHSEDREIVSAIARTIVSGMYGEN